MDSISLKPSIQEKTDELLRFLPKANDQLNINSVDFPKPFFGVANQAICFEPLGEKQQSLIEGI